MGNNTISIYSYEKIKQKMADKNMSEEDYLKKHLDDTEGKKETKKSNVVTKVDSTTVGDLQFFNFDIRELPCGNFYPNGTMLMIRPAQVKEIQAYSMVDDSNLYDVIEKMNDILRSCVRVKYPDGTLSSYLDIKDQDRIYLVFAIRELTFQKGNSLSLSTICKDCQTENQVELVRKNFRFHKLEDKIMKHFNKSTNSFLFRTKSGNEFTITPPNIGLQKSFTDYIIKENSEKKVPNLSFLKIIPFTLNGKNSIEYDEIKEKLLKFESIDDMSFQFLNSVVSKMTFGIKELCKNCESCGLEIHTDMQFPNGASGIFVIHDAFEAFIEE